MIDALDQIEVEERKDNHFVEELRKVEIIKKSLDNVREHATK